MGKINRSDLWDPEKVKEIIALYESGISCTKIATLCGSSNHTISKILKSNGISVVNRQNEIKFTIEEIKDDYCNKKLSLTQIAKNRNTSNNLLSKMLKANGIEVHNFHNMCKFNECIFDEIDTEEKAYWLGFIYADGHISSSGYAFSIELSGKDVLHLEKFNTFMEYKGNNVKYGIVNFKGKQYTRSRWCICSKHLWETLNNYGCVPRKSLILKFPDKSIFREEWLIIPFIRGYFDGDGCLCQVHSENKIGSTLQCSLLGTEEMLSPIRDLFFHLPFHNNSKSNQITKSYSLSEKQSITFLEIIYYKAKIYLDRKYNKFIEWKNCRPKVKALGVLESKFGEYWDANPELIYGFKRS